ncbi:PI-PLC X domain-containing protein 1 [Trichonephila clavata]|uniref:PI-PLC X domain-containing protein 1 n=1 Tax=Trichonephila clavata TaxID=2740835 RepID=A0A8X6F2C5_TRICU|nr:PI-PLC X domain-containing protein 1 [Trichonephila clavata]
MLRYSLIIIVFVVCVNLSLVSSFIDNFKDCQPYNPDSIQIFLTISSLYSFFTKNGLVQRWLEINWVAKNSSEGDIINVYNQDPIHNSSQKPLLTMYPKKYPSGYFRTSIKIPVEASFLNPQQKSPCLGYWATYFNEKGKIQASTCLKMHPFWMEQISKYISHLRLDEIMIPGSHDSGSFNYNKKTIPYTRYKYSQEFSTFNQLVYGLRYFDLRVGYYKKTYAKYFINHNFLKTDHTVKSVLDQVKLFLKTSKREIIILDFHNFPHGFETEEIHLKLINLIKSELGLIFIPYSLNNANLHDIWKSGKNVIVSYNYKFTNGTPAYLWPSIPRAWGNKHDKESLRAYFQEVFSKPTPKGLWAAMAEMTPDTLFILFHPENGLRNMAEQINGEVTHWFRDLYWQKANIVATDYFLGNHVIDVAIRTNQVKGVCPKNILSQLRS